jgi:hypothetical protein
LLLLLPPPLLLLLLLKLRLKSQEERLNVWWSLRTFV